MRFSAEVVPIGFGVYGPFKDADDPNRTIPYLEFADSDGGGSDRATAAEGVTFEKIALFQPIKLDFELYSANDKRKLRTYGPTGAASAPAAARAAA